MLILDEILYVGDTLSKLVDKRLHVGIELLERRFLLESDSFAARTEEEVISVCMNVVYNKPTIDAIATRCL